MTPPSSRLARREAPPVPRLTTEQLAIATPLELEAYEKALRLDLALSSPVSYAEHVSPWFERQPHIDLLDNLIVQLTSDQLRNDKGEVIRRLAVSMPPRHSKSETISSHTPAWAVTKYPDWRIMLASYDGDFAATWGRKARQHLEEHPEFGISVAQDSHAAKSWNISTPHRGGMVTAGVGGPATGKGAHLLIIDDYLKNSADAQSSTIRQKQWEWWLSTAKSRLEPGGYVIILATRWHEDDLIGRVTTLQPERWRYLNLPAIAEDDDPLGRAPGEALCPAWYDIDALNDIKSDEVDGKWWSALYQGHPTTAGGGIFKEANFRYWTRTATHYVLGSAEGAMTYVPVADCVRFATVDLAATMSTRADFSVIATWDVTPAREMLLVDLVRVRIESSEHREWMAEHYARVAPRYAIVENKTFGMTLLQSAYKDGMVLRPDAKGNKDKMSQAIPAGAAIDGGRVYFPTADVAPWLPAWTSELTSFPNGTHDDQVDVLSMAAAEITTGSLAIPMRTNKTTDPGGLEGRIARYKASKRRGAGKTHHPDLGRV